MEFSGRYQIAAPPQQVWDCLNDPEIVKACLPGCERFVRVAADHFQADATIRTGFMKARYQGDLVQSGLTPPWRCVLTGEAEGGPAGALKGEIEVILEEDAGGTILNYRARGEVSGKLAQMGHRTIHGMSKQVGDEFFRRLDALLVEKGTGVMPNATPASRGMQNALSREPAAPEVWVVGLIGVVVILLVLFGLTL